MFNNNNNNPNNMNQMPMPLLSMKPQPVGQPQIQPLMYQPAPNMFDQASLNYFNKIAFVNSMPHLVPSDLLFKQQSQQQTQLAPPYQLQPAPNDTSNDVDFTSKIQRFDRNEVKVEIKNKKTKEKRPQIEIQTIDYNHGLTSTVSSINSLSSIKASLSTNNNNISSTNQHSAPPSLLSLKVSTPVNMKPLQNSQSVTNQPTTNLFPILNSTPENKTINNNIPNPNSNLIVPIESILLKPGRDKRPSKIVIILRGPPGSGKSFLANLIKQEEEKHVSSSDKPKIFSIDNYFICENDHLDNSSNSKYSMTMMKYVYDKEMDETYQRSLIKSFKKNIDDKLFNFIIVDMILNKLTQLDEISSYARSRGFYTFVIELNNENAEVCFNRNVHNRTYLDIQKIIKEWEKLPNSFTRLDVSFFLHNQEIQYVEMDDIDNNDDVKGNLSSTQNQKTESITPEVKRELNTSLKSKWDTIDNEYQKNSKKTRNNESQWQ